MQTTSKRWERASKIWLFVWTIIAIAYVITHFPFPQLEIVYENY